MVCLRIMETAMALDWGEGCICCMLMETAMALDLGGQGESAACLWNRPWYLI